MSNIERLLDNFLVSYDNMKKLRSLYIDKDKYLTENTGNYVHDLIKLIQLKNFSQDEIKMTQEAIDKMEPLKQLNRLLEIEKEILEQKGNMLNRTFSVNGIIFKFLDKNETQNRDKDDKKTIRVSNEKNINKKMKIIYKNILRGTKHSDPDIILCGYIQNVIIYKNIQRDNYYIYVYPVFNKKKEIKVAASNIITLLYALKIDGEWGGEFNKIDTVNISMFDVDTNNYKYEAVAKYIINELQNIIKNNNYTFIKMIEFNYDYQDDSFYKAYLDMVK